MPRITPLAALATTLHARGWTHLDARLALQDPLAVAWQHGAGLVSSFGPPAVVHAIEEQPLGPSATLLAEVLPALPRRLELRVGPAAAGILAETHQIEMLGPMRRLVWTGDAGEADVERFIPVPPRRAASLHDRDAPPPPDRPEVPGWLGLRRDGHLVAAMGPARRGAGVVRLCPPRIQRGARNDPDLSALIASTARLAASHGTVFLDLRADRRDRLGLLVDAGFEPAGAWERWSAVRA